VAERPQLQRQLRGRQKFQVPTLPWSPSNGSQHFQWPEPVMLLYIFRLSFVDPDVSCRPISYLLKHSTFSFYDFLSLSRLIFQLLPSLRHPEFTMYVPRNSSSTPNPQQHCQSNGSWDASTIYGIVFGIVGVFMGIIAIWQGRR